MAPELNADMIANTRDVLEDMVREGRHDVMVCGREFDVFEGVFSPKYFFSSAWFSSKIAGLVEEDSAFLEVGAGSGVVAVTATVENDAVMTYATDISEKACENIRHNAHKHNVYDQIRVLRSDVYKGIPDGAPRFDAIFWAGNFGYVDADEEMDDIGRMVFDPGYEAFNRFLEHGESHLASHGVIFFAYSEVLAHPKMLRLAREHGYGLEVIAETRDREGDKEVDMKLVRAST